MLLIMSSMSKSRSKRCAQTGIKVSRIHRKSSLTSPPIQSSTAMFASRIVSVALFFSTFGLSIASPAALAERASPADVQGVLATLKGHTDTILPQIDALSASGTANEDNVTPLVTQLTTAIDAATGSLTALSVVPRGTAFFKRQSDDDVAQTLAGIITDITTSFDGLNNSGFKSEKFPGLVILLKLLDISLSKLLFSVELLLAGVLKLVAKLLVDVAILLKNLSFALVLSALELK